MAFAEFCEFDEQQVRQVEREGQITWGFGTSVAKHHALVARALRFFFAAVHAAVDVARLLVNGSEHTA